MEQIPEVKDFHKRKARANSKKGMGKIGDAFELGKVCSLPGMYLGSDAASSSISGTKNSLPQKRNSKWHVQTPELKERISHQNVQLNHDNSCYMDKIFKARSAVSDLQPSFSYDYDMFPPLSSQIGIFKPKKHEAKKKNLKEEHENNGERTVKPLSPLQNKSECKASNFWSIRREKTFPAQAGDRKMITSLHGNSEPDIHLKSNTQNKQVNKHIKMSNICVSLGELSLNSRHKSKELESDRGLAWTNEEGIHDKTTSGFFCSLEKSHVKKEARKNTYLSTKNNVGKHIEDNLYDSDDSCRKSDISQQSYSLLDSSLDKSDAVSDFEYTHTPHDSTEDALFCYSKIQIISYLGMLLKNKYSCYNDAAKSTTCLPLPECAAAGEPEPKPDTVDEGVTLKTEAKILYEDYLVWEEMLNNFIIACNLPFGVSKEQILNHMHKVGSVCYIVMKRNRAHIIFLKAEDAAIAFGLKHVLFGRELVVCRPRCPTCTLHLSGLTNSTSDGDLIKVVSSYGIVLGFYRPTNKITFDPMGYCFIEVDKQVAENILNQSSLIVNNVRIFAEVSSQSEVKFSGQTYSCQQPSSVLAPLHFQRNNDEFKGILTNLPELASYDLIKEHFQQFGKLQKVFVRKKKGYVLFASRDSLEQALSSKHTILGIEVKLFQASSVSF